MLLDEWMDQLKKQSLATDLGNKQENVISKLDMLFDIWIWGIFALLLDMKANYISKYSPMKAK